jgi:hypothetical protein
VADLLGVELVRPGTWDLARGKQTFTDQMLRDAADFYAASGGQRIPLGFGHRDSRFDGEPAFGWLANVRYEQDDTGPVLLGDLVDMDDWVAAAAPDRWPHRSVEGVMGVTFDGREYGLALTRLALLGSTPPGIPVLKSLSDVRQLVAARRRRPAPSGSPRRPPNRRPYRARPPPRGRTTRPTEREPPACLTQPSSERRSALRLTPPTTR